MTVTSVEDMRVIQEMYRLTPSVSSVYKSGGESSLKMVSMAALGISAGATVVSLVLGAFLSTRNEGNYDITVSLMIAGIVATIAVFIIACRLIDWAGTRHSRYTVRRALREDSVVADVARTFGISAEESLGIFVNHLTGSEEAKRAPVILVIGYPTASDDSKELRLMARTNVSPVMREQLEIAA